jgi:hypothetical protein
LADVKIKATAIENDRELLSILGLSDPDAAEYLSKSRQTLNTMLRSGDDAPRDYFRLSDIYLLISAAERHGHSYDREAVLEYIKDTRTPEPGSTKKGSRKRARRDFDMLIERLSPAESWADEDVYAVIYVLPAFSEMRNHLPRQRDILSAQVAEFNRAEHPVEMFCVSTTDVQAQMAGASIGINDTSRCAGKAIVDHYQPMALYYIHGSEHPKCRILTQHSGMVDAPYFRTDMIQACVEGLLTDEQRKSLAQAE